MSGITAVVELPAGQFIFKEGDRGTDMYVIESGSVEIFRGARTGEALAMLGPGDFFGEMAILEDEPRFASAVVSTPCRLRRIDRAHFTQLIAQDSEIAVRIMRKLAARLRRSNSSASTACSVNAWMPRTSRFCAGLMFSYSLAWISVPRP